jgi:protein-disulfide isomerase
MVLRVAEGRALEFQHLGPRIIERINGYYGYEAVAALKILQGTVAPPRRGFGRSLSKRSGTSGGQARGVHPRRGLRAALLRLGTAVSHRDAPHHPPFLQHGYSHEARPPICSRRRWRGCRRRGARLLRVPRPPADTATRVPGVSQATAQTRDLSSLDEPPASASARLGDDDAPVTMIEYASATCPHCARYHTDTFATIKEEYVDTGRVRYVFREFPFDDLALAAFMLARCAPEERFFSIIDVLFEQQQTWTQNPREELLKIARMAGFTPETFDQCLQNEDMAKGILEIRTTADEQYGVNSTPTFFINGQVIQGNQPIERFREAIEDAEG